MNVLPVEVVVTHEKGCRPSLIPWLRGDYVDSRCDVTGDCVQGLDRATPSQSLTRLAYNSTAPSTITSIMYASAPSCHILRGVLPVVFVILLMPMRLRRPVDSREMGQICFQYVQFYSPSSVPPAGIWIILPRHVGGTY